VDEDVDLYDSKDVLWAVVTRTQLEEDLNVIRHVMGFSRDPHHRYKSKLAIDATFPLEQKEGFGGQRFSTKESIWRGILRKIEG
jgi:3-polyprenyl-4-hydroxybenzoate decarboxylase